MAHDTATLTKAEIRRILRRHHGVIGELARDLNLDPSSISKWLHNQGTSARIAKAAQIKAQQLLEQERKSSHAA